MIARNVIRIDVPCSNVWLRTSSTWVTGAIHATTRRSKGELNDPHERKAMAELNQTIAEHCEKDIRTINDRRLMDALVPIRNAKATIAISS